MAKLTGIKAVLADPKRLAKWKANGGLRSKLPDQYLTQEQRVARRLNREIFPGAGVTGLDQVRQAKSATDEVYDPQRRALVDERAVVQAQRNRNAGWWDQYQAQLRAMQVPQPSAGLGGQLGQYGAAPSQPVVDASQNAPSQAMASLARGLLDAQVARVGQRKLEDVALSDARERGVVQKQGQVEVDAARYKQQYKDKVASDTRKQYLEDIGFGLKKADMIADNQRADASLAASTRNQSQNRSIARARLRESERAAREREATARRREAKKAADKKPGSPARQKQWDQAIATLRSGKTAWLDGKGQKVWLVNGKAVKVAPGSNPPDGAELRKREYTPAFAESHREELINALVLKKKVSRDIAARAVDHFIKGD